jgi:hypothetical protein
MKKYSLLVVLFFSFIALLSTNAQTNVTLKATLKTTSNVAIPNVYVKVYLPGESTPSDSLFSNADGVIDHTLPFTYSGSSSIYFPNSPDVIIKGLSPNIIQAPFAEYTLVYDYPFEGKIKLVDMLGKEHSNHSPLNPGNYYYFVKFADGYVTRKMPLVVINKTQLHIELINKNNPQPSVRQKVSQLLLNDVSVFYAHYIKDGYITKIDTIIVDSVVIDKAYQLSEAPLPTADFTTTGALQLGEVVMFDASASSGGDGEDLTYLWDFGDDKKGQEVTLPHLFTLADNYDVTLTVTGNYGAKHSVTKQVSIATGSTASGHAGIIKGVVTDELEEGIGQASITLLEDDITATANDTGYVTMSGLPVGIPLHFKITKAGYVNQTVELTIPEDTEEAYFFTTLKSRDIAITLPDAEFGGEVMGADGTTVNLPVEALTNEDGTRITGDVDISITPVDVTTESSAFPGSFEGIRTGGESAVLLSYGVSEFHFQQGDEELELAPGKTAELLIPIYTTGAQVGDEIPLWSINEDNGTWIQEGIGTVVASDESPTGLAFRAEVGHFSWWNCDDFDDDRRKDGLCWRWECTASQCIKVKVGCWMSGARRNTGEPANKSAKGKGIRLKRAETPPVFEVREFVPATGSSLRFPGSLDIYLEGRGFNEYGELMVGNRTVLASDLTDTFSIELTSVADIFDHDTVDLPINTTINEYVGPEQFKHFLIDPPEPKLYLLNLIQGEYPSLVGRYFVKNNGEIVNNGPVGYDMPQYVFADTGYVVVSVVGETETDSGNVSISWDEIESTSIELNDSVAGTLADYTEVDRYSISTDTAALMLARFYIAPGDNPYGRVRLISPSGEEIVEEGLDETERDFSAVLVKDSVYFFEVTSNKQDPFVYYLITREDQPGQLEYGDTIIDRLNSSDDVDLFQFDGTAGDLVHIKGSRPDYELYGGVFSLLDIDGVEIAQGTTTDNYVSEEHEIVYKLPESGTYSIKVFSVQNDTGRYQIILNNPAYSTLPYNELTTLSADAETEYFFELTIPDGKITNLTLKSDVGGGIYALRDSVSLRLNPYGNWHFGNYYLAPFTAPLDAGVFYLVVANEVAGTVYINLQETTPLSFNEKGLAQRADTLYQNFEVKAYHYTSMPGNGIHAVMRTLGSNKVPFEMEIEHYLPDGTDEQFYGTDAQMDHHSIDSTIIVESAGQLDGELADTTRILLVYADSTGVFDFNLYHVAASDSIAVDNDFAELPDAHTASVMAAGYAVNPGGTIYVGNGEYRHYLPLTIEADSVSFIGQDKHNTWLTCVRAYSYKEICNFNSAHGLMENFTLSSALENYYSVKVIGDYVTLNNLNITNYGEFPTTGGQIKTVSSFNTLSNITISNAQRGMDIKGSNNVVENCNLSTNTMAIESAGLNHVFRNNTITLNTYSLAIRITGSGGNHRIDSNTVHVNYTGGGGSYGILAIDERGTVSDDHTSYIRGNTIYNSSNNYALYGSVDYPPSQLIIENNRIYNTAGSDAKALYLYPARHSGASSMIVRNNVFESITPDEAIYILYPDYIAEGEYLGIANNSFSIDTTMSKDASEFFVETWSTSGFTDTANVYLINNAVEANDSIYFIDFHTDFSLYSNYNVLHRFKNYQNEEGTLIGMDQDILEDPQYADSTLQVMPSSPVINNGASSSQYEFIPDMDIDGVGRPQESVWDIGAFEKPE